MAQRSRFWDGTTIGDATVAPYDAGTEFSEVMTAVAGLTSDPNKGGVVSSISVSMFAPGTLRIGPFEAIVYGAWYQNDANIDIAISTPASATRINTIVLRKSWAAQTVRILSLAGIEGGSAPALVQTPGVTWDVPIATVSTTTGGVSTITPTSTRADLWYRTAVDSIRTDNLAGILATAPAWGAGNAVLHMGQGGAVAGHVAAPRLDLSSNTYHDGTNRRAISTGAGALLRLDSGNLTYDTAPSVAAGSSQVFTTKVTIDSGGRVGVGITPPPFVTNYGAVYAGIIGLYATGGSLSGGIRFNSYFDGTVNRNIIAGEGMDISLASNQIRFFFSPSVAAGATQAMVERFTFLASGRIAVQSTATNDTNWFTMQGPSSVGGSEMRGVGLGHSTSFGQGENTTVFGGFNNKYNQAVCLMNGYGGGGGGDVTLYPAGGQVRPQVNDAVYWLGTTTPSMRWYAVSAYLGTIQTCEASQKENISLLDPLECVAAVLETDWVRFSYFVPNEEIFPEYSEQFDADRAARDAWIAETRRERIVISEGVRHQKGYVLGSPAHNTHDMFGLSNRKNATPSSDLGVVACALQHALKEIAELKAYIEHTNGRVLEVEGVN